MKIEYSHNNYIQKLKDYNFFGDSGTLAVEIPSKDKLELVASFELLPIIKLYVGLSIVHPKDRFNKAVGRSISRSNVKLLEFQLKSIDFRKNKKYYYLHTTLEHNNRTRPIHICLSTASANPHVKLEYGDINGR